MWDVPSGCVLCAVMISSLHTVYSKLPLYIVAKWQLEIAQSPDTRHVHLATAANESQSPHPLCLHKIFRALDG